MGQFINTFSQGLDQDSSKNRYDNTHYFSAENIRPITQESLSSGAIENLLGNVRRLNCTNNLNNRVIGYTVMRDHVILFTTTNNTDIPNTSSIDTIWKVAISEIESLTNLNFLTLNGTPFHLGGHQIYEGQLGFCTGNKIKAVSRFENDDIQKVYWVDGFNNLRHINVVHDANVNNLSTLQADKLEVISNFELTRPELSGFESGNLRAGKVQYSYQLYVLNGGETVFSPPSHLINITESNEQASTSDGYMGSNLDTITGKAVRCSIDIQATGYNRVRIIAIHYTTLQGDPHIRTVEEKEISTLGETISFVDAGQNYGSYILEQIRILGTFLFSPKELAVKDNILFPANIVEKAFDINFDARTYRFAGKSSVTTEPNYQSVAGIRQKSRIYDSQGNYYEGDGLNPTGTWTGSGLANITGWANIPADFDAINRFNDLDNDGNHNFRFMYQSDGITLGGEGPRIKYVFKVKTVELDDNSGIPFIRTGLEAVPNNPSFNNYASPYQCARYLGYARDETYRFGIVFFDEKGRSSFVKWIGDIRMPSISTKNTVDNYTPDGGPSTWQIDRIKFNDYSPFGGKYSVTINNDPGPTGYSYTELESSPFDTMNSVMEALGIFPDIIVSNVDLVNNQFDITYQMTGSHTIQIRRFIEYHFISQGIPKTEMVEVSINYTVTNIRSYSPAVGNKTDFNTVYYDTAVSKTKMNILYPEFTVNLAGSEAEGLSYQIVRVQRQSNDRSIRAQGMVTGTLGSGNTRYPYLWGQGVSWDTSVVCFNSPEVAFNKNLVRQSGDKLQIAAVTNNAWLDISGNILRVKYRGYAALNDPQDPASLATSGDEFYQYNSSQVDAATLVTMDTNEAVLGPISYFRGVRTVGNAEENTDKGVNLLSRLNSSSWMGYNTGSTARHLVNYRRNTFLYQYGGNTYESRSRNVYMATGRVQKLDLAVIPVFDGDTYIAMFDYLNAGWKESSETGKSDIAIFPVETSINLELRMDSSYHVQQAVTPSHQMQLMREKRGIYVSEIGGNTITYTQPTDLYIYNTVYSKENTTIVHLIRPFDWKQQTKFDTRVLSSNVKINNELSDSWLNFGANAYLDVDPQYGELTALINIGDQMLFFQPKAFGTLSINERALLQTTSIAQLSLGTSGVLARFDYAKTEMGLSHKDHIVLSQNGLYWLDVITKSMYKFTGGPEEISLMKGMSSWFKSNINQSTVLRDILLFSDPAYKEISLVCSTSGKEYHLVYNEITDSFTSFYTYYPKFVINYEDKVLSSNDRLSFYRHNDLAGSRCVFYNSAAQPSNITLIVNPDPLATKVFNNLEWLTEVYNGNDNIHNETFNSVTVSNDYQDTGTISLTPANLKRRLRRWRHTIGRAVYTETGAAQTRGDARIRDSYMKLKLEFSNTSSRRLVAHDIITSYMITNK